jgi:hypothetical protein
MSDRLIDFMGRREQASRHQPRPPKRKVVFALSACFIRIRGRIAIAMTLFQLAKPSKCLLKTFLDKQHIGRTHLPTVGETFKRPV